MRRVLFGAVILGVFAVTAFSLNARQTSNLVRGNKPGEWRYWGADAWSTRYSPLDQINASNFSTLKVAWQWNAGAFGEDEYYRATPLYANGRLFTVATTRRAAMAIDPETGETLWMYRLEEGIRWQKAPRQFAGRGLAYWTDGREERVLLCMLDTIDWPTAFLGCLKAGVVAVPVNTLMTEDDYRFMLADSRARLLVVSDALYPRFEKPIKESPDLEHVVVSGDSVHGHRAFEDLIASAKPDPATAATKRDEIAFWLYTSGSTGKPKGVLHTTGGYLVYTSITHQHVFDYHDGDIYWCTADVGWVTGHSYIVYGPLANGATTLMFEGVPNYPDASRFWEVVDKHKVTFLFASGITTVVAKQFHMTFIAQLVKLVKRHAGHAAFVLFAWAIHIEVAKAHQLMSTALKRVTAALAHALVKQQFGVPIDIERALALGRFAKHLRAAIGGRR